MPISGRLGEPTLPQRHRKRRALQGQVGPDLRAGRKSGQSETPCPKSRAHPIRYTTVPHRPMLVYRLQATRAASVHQPCSSDQPVNRMRLQK